MNVRWRVDEVEVVMQRTANGLEDFVGDLRGGLVFGQGVWVVEGVV